MRRLALAFLAVSLVAAACSSGSDSQVASLEDATASDDVAAAEVDTDAANEDAILEFSQCMRDEGIDGFEDPDIGEDGTIEFKLGGRVEDAEVDRDTMRAAFEACQDHLEGLAFGPGAFDRAEIEDTLLEFAVCMREHGVDMPDPDFSNFGPGSGGEGGGEGGIFGGAIDLDDPGVEEALEACEEVFGGSLRLGGPGGQGDG